ncbi:hypothetical protein FA95DRAFT_1676641 [Auriscalpium vulgare]|uniref:Uncharacterized protein n=1 Tax=Auriscalpium vulgare TaxID=40419 RepID=A0ACB8S3A2_9AGAM|nr:hypothetical protein FA95DRAFT_1676641 [Auriscalpium vulgare]
MAKGKKSSLRAALSSQQSRLKKNQQAKDAERAAEQKLKQKPKGPKGKGKAVPKQRRPTIPFAPTDTILLIGEGNFSFAKALVAFPPPSLEHLPSVNVTATAYDTEEECYQKYPGAEENVRVLREKGGQVYFGVDATRLDKAAPLKNRRYDRIVWNFPHAGKGITDQDRNILSNQVLILGFLRSAERFLAVGPVPQVHARRRKKPSEDDDEDREMSETEQDGGDTRSRGTILITLRNVPPYTEWDVARLAKNPPPPKAMNEPHNPYYTLLRSFAFHREDWEGYEHRMTKGERMHGQGKTGEGGEDRTWEFCIKDEV